MIKAILFDCDGTLVDSESQTGQSISMVLERHGFPDLEIPTSWTRGVAWEAITAQILKVYPQLPPTPDYTQEFVDTWDSLVTQAPAIPGAPAAVEEAHRWFSIALVTSSHHKSVDPMLTSLGMARFFPKKHRICAENVTRSKPDPQGYLLAAEKLGVQPHECLVFEDSEAGLKASRAAGMQSMAVLETNLNPGVCRELADHSIQNFNDLPLSFWCAMANPSTCYPSQSSLIQACL